MRLSRHAILAPVPGRDQVLLVQPLTGQAALLEPASARALEGLASGGPLPADLPVDTLREAGFVVDSDDEDRAFVDAARAEWRVEAAKTPTQLVVVPSFGCNLACTYCYQELFDPAAAGLISPEAIDAFFAYVDRHHAGESPRPYITLFGGEPLRDTPAHHDRIGRFLDGARARGMEVAVVTNGHDLAAFLPLLSSGPVKEVQVTLDGPAALHDRRRPHAGGAGTFDRIVAGIDGLVAAGIPVNLRVVADRENLPALARAGRVRRASAAGSTCPSSRFKTQIGRNYELFGCASRQEKGALFDRVELWAQLRRAVRGPPGPAPLPPAALPRHRPPGRRRRASRPQLRRLPGRQEGMGLRPRRRRLRLHRHGGPPRAPAGQLLPRGRRATRRPSPAGRGGAPSPSRPATAARSPRCAAAAAAPSPGASTGRPSRPTAARCPALYGLGARFYGLGRERGRRRRAGARPGLPGLRRRRSPTRRRPRPPPAPSAASRSRAPPAARTATTSATPATPAPRRTSSSGPAWVHAGATRWRSPPRSCATPP